MTAASAEAPGLGRLDDGRGQRVLAARARGSRRAQDLGVVGAVERRPRRATRGRPSVRVPVLSTTRVSTRRERLERLGVFGRGRPAVGPAAHPDHDRHGGGEAERAGTGDDEHRDRRHEGVGEARLGPEGGPGQRRPATATATTAGTNQAATASARRWMGARLRCASATSWTMWASSVLAPHPLGPHHEAAGAVEGGAGDPRRPAPSPPGIGSPVIIDSSTRARALEHDAVHGHLLAGRTRRRSPGTHVVERHVRLGPVGADAPRGLGGETEERPDGAARPLPRPQLEHLPEQHERRRSPPPTRSSARPRRRAPRKDAGKRPGARVATRL